MVTLKLTEEERALLAKLATKRNMTEADYLRVCMVMDGVMDGDKDAVKIVGGKLRDVVGKRISELCGFDFKDAPVKA
jgi:hypothetical protein